MPTPEVDIDGQATGRSTRVRSGRSTSGRSRSRSRGRKADIDKNTQRPERRKKKRDRHRGVKSASGSKHERSTSGTSSSSRRRHREEQEAKDRARCRNTPNHSSSSSRPGATRSSSDRAHRKASGDGTSHSRSFDISGELVGDFGYSSHSRRRRDEKHGHRNKGSATPGAVPERIDQVRRKKAGRGRSGGSKHRDEKSGHRNKGVATPGALPERIDRVPRKKIAGGRNGHSRSSSENNTKTVASNDEEKQEEEEHLAQATVIDGAGGKTSEHSTEEARLMTEGEAVRLNRQREEEQRQEEAMARGIAENDAKKKRQRCRGWLVVFLFTTLIGGGSTAAYFGLFGASGSNPTSPVVVSPTESPTTHLSSAPTDGATIPFKYHPPSPEDCQRLTNDLPPLTEDEDLLIRTFGVTAEVGISSNNTETETILSELDEKIYQYLVPSLVGCQPVDSGRWVRQLDLVGGIRGHSRRLQDPTLRYMVAHADVEVVEGSECLLAKTSKCGSVQVNLSLTLRGDEKNFNVLLLLLQFFPEDQDLYEDIGLSALMNSFVVASVQPVDLTPSCIPSASPSDQPSYIPSGSPSGAPSGMPSESPSAKPSVMSSGSPTSVPSSIPSQSPSTFPTMVPSTSPSTPNPTSTPTRFLSASPTRSPSPKPSVIPTIRPSLVPSKAPTESPTPRPSRRPTVSPSSNPTNSIRWDFLFWIEHDTNVAVFTTNTVTVKFYSDDQLVGSQQFDGVDVDANIATIHTWQEVDKVEISIDGIDRMFIDYARLAKEATDIVGSWGIDEGSGWCISTDTTESFASQAGDCAPSMTFAL